MEARDRTEARMGDFVGVFFKNNALTAEKAGVDRRRHPPFRRVLIRETRIAKIKIASSESFH